MSYRQRQRRVKERWKQSRFILILDIQYLSVSLHRHIDLLIFHMNVSIILSHSENDSCFFFFFNWNCIDSMVVSLGGTITVKTLCQGPEVMHRLMSGGKSWIK